MPRLLTYSGEITVLADENGNVLVDENGNAFVAMQPSMQKILVYGNLQNIQSVKILTFGNGD